MSPQIIDIDAEEENNKERVTMEDENNTVVGRNIKCRPRPLRLLHKSQIEYKRSRRTRRWFQ